jgi:hypothetical protein
VIDWAMRAHGVSFLHAVALLRDKPLCTVAGNTKVSRVRKLDMAVNISVDDVRVLEQVTGYYPHWYGWHRGVWREPMTGEPAIWSAAFGNGKVSLGASKMTSSRACRLR